MLRLVARRVHIKINIHHAMIGVSLCLFRQSILRVICCPL